MKSKFKKVFVLAPAKYATGGVELAHQLVDVINNDGGEAYIVYEKDGKIIPNLPVTSAYISYNIKVANKIEDSDKNILVLPEIYFDYTYRFSKMSFGLWWMSVDNHYHSTNWRDVRYSPGGIIDKINYIRSYLRKRSKNKIRDLKKIEDRIVNLYQSAYAQNHLYNLGFSRVLPLKDYINTAFTAHNINLNSTRKNTVLYNPAKGWRFTKKIIAANPDITFVPLKNLSREQLQDLMQTAKLYIDFGNFPGKDRLPREAALNGLCIITGKNGASRFYEDIAIDNQYKFQAIESNIPYISKKIREVLIDYQLRVSDFNFFREQIIKEKEEFIQQIHTIFFNQQPSK